MTREKIVNSMSLQDAIQVLKDTNCYGTMDIAKTVILKALEQEPCIDAISRQAAIDVIYDNEYKKDMRKALEALPFVTPAEKVERDRMAEERGGDYSGVEALTLLMSTMGEILNEMAKYAERALLYGTDHEQVRWLPNFRYGTHKSEKFFICSNCKEQNMEKSAYCPHCGREMQNHE